MMHLAYIENSHLPEAQVLCAPTNQMHDCLIQVVSTGSSQPHLVMMLLLLPEFCCMLLLEVLQLPLKLLQLLSGSLGVLLSSILQAS